MTTPVWALLGFAVWTVAVLLFSVGLYRWSRILTGRVQIKDFRADEVAGPDWYRRAMRAHANCVENLPVFAAVVFAGYAAGVDAPAADRFALLALAARVLQSVVHVTLMQTNVVAAVRFALFFVQLVCFLGLAALAALAPA